MNVEQTKLALLARLGERFSEYYGEIVRSSYPLPVYQAAMVALQEWREEERDRIEAGAEDFTRE